MELKLPHRKRDSKILEDNVKDLYNYLQEHLPKKYSLDLNNSCDHICVSFCGTNIVVHDAIGAYLEYKHCDFYEPQRDKFDYAILGNNYWIEIVEEYMKSRFETHVQFIYHGSSPKHEAWFEFYTISL